jgi:lipoprotein-anchoring transpeptidase ErfK/SrfK
MRSTNAWCAAIVALALAALSCSKEEAKDRVATTSAKVKKTAGEAIDIAVPIGEKDDPAAQERERFDEGWRGLESLREAQAGQRRAVPASPRIQFAANGKESFEGLDASAINRAPVAVPLKGDVRGPSVLKTQVYLDRVSFSVGALDGRWGRNTAIALWWYQRSRGIDAAEPGALDETTFRALAAEAGGVDAVVQHTVTGDDVKGPFVTVPEDVYEQEKLDCLCYESRKEKLAELFHTTEELLELLNPDVDLDAVDAGRAIWVPNVRMPRSSGAPDVARVVISIRGNTFNAFDAQGNLIFHAPTTLGSKYDPSPRETLEVKKTTFDPWFHYQPTLFHEVPDHEPEANLAPGPNSPVGVVWISLSKPHYGIHGTSSPRTIGYTSSHGCVRLTNWDAREVGQRISPGVKVEFRDTRGSGE